MKLKNQLLSKKVLIVGCGGLGTSIGLAIGSSGVGYIDLVDFDEVAIHNIHRQIAFELKDNLNSKASILAKKIESRNPFVKLKVYRMDFEKFSTDKECKYDIVIDATDNLSVRAEIDLWTKKGNTPWIYGSVEEFNAQSLFIWIKHLFLHLRVEKSTKRYYSSYGYADSFTSSKFSLKIFS